MSNKNYDWIDFVRLYQAETGLPWNEAMKQAGGSYREAQIDRILQEGYEKRQALENKRKYKRKHKVDQDGGAIFDTLLGGNQIQKLVNYGIQLMGESKFFGLDGKTVGNLVNLVIETGKSAGSLTEMLTIIQQNPYANQISQIPFTTGPAGVKDSMQIIIEAIDKEPNGADIYTALCAIYKTVLVKSSKIFIKIIGSLAPGSAEAKANNQNRLIRAIQNLNYDALANEYNGLPSLVKQLVEDPTALQTIITQVMGVLSQSSGSLGSFIQNNLYPVLNSTIEAVRRVLPITFATIILLERCGGLPAEEIEQLNKLIQTTSTPEATVTAAPLIGPNVGPVAPVAAAGAAAAPIALTAAQELAALQQIKDQQDRIAKLEAALITQNSQVAKPSFTPEQLRQAQLQQQEILIRQQAEQLRKLQEQQALQQRQLGTQLGGRKGRKGRKDSKGRKIVR